MQALRLLTSALLLLVCVPAHALTLISSCPQTLSTNGELYEFSADFGTSGSPVDVDLANCIDITGDNITLDTKGYDAWYTANNAGQAFINVSSTADNWKVYSSVAGTVIRQPSGGYEGYGFRCQDCGSGQLGDNAAAQIEISIQAVKKAEGAAVYFKGVNSYVWQNTVSRMYESQATGDRDSLGSTFITDRTSSSKMTLSIDNVDLYGVGAAVDTAIWHHAANADITLNDFHIALDGVGDAFMGNITNNTGTDTWTITNSTAYGRPIVVVTNQDSITNDNQTDCGLGIINEVDNSSFTGWHCQDFHIANNDNSTFLDFQLCGYPLDSNGGCQSYTGGEVYLSNNTDSEVVGLQAWSSVNWNHGLAMQFRNQNERVTVKWGDFRCASLACIYGYASSSNADISIKENRFLLEDCSVVTPSICSGNTNNSINAVQMRRCHSCEYSSNYVSAAPALTESVAYALAHAEHEATANKTAIQPGTYDLDWWDHVINRPLIDDSVDYWLNVGDAEDYDGVQGNSAVVTNVTTQYPISSAKFLVDQTPAGNLPIYLEVMTTPDVFNPYKTGAVCLRQYEAITGCPTAGDGPCPIQTNDPCTR